MLTSRRRAADVAAAGERLRQSTRPPTGNGHPIWLFAGSDQGGHRAAAIFSLIETAKLNHVDPQAWLADTIARIADHPARRIDELLPWNRRPA